MARKRRGAAFTGLAAKAITRGAPFVPTERGAIGNSSNGRVGGRVGAVKIRGKHVNKRAGMATRMLRK